MKNIIIIHRLASKYLERINEPLKSKLQKAIKSLQDGEGDIKKLKGVAGYYRLRAGNYRILFFYYDENHIMIYRIGQRGQVYKEIQ